VHSASLSASPSTSLPRRSAAERLRAANAGARPDDEIGRRALTALLLPTLYQCFERDTASAIMMATSQPLPATKRLPQQVVLLGWVSFCQDLSGEMVNPVVPLFLVGVLGASATSVGWVDGVATAAIAIMMAWAGWRSDRIVRGIRRRVPWIRWGYGLPIIGKLMLALAVGWPMVMGGRTVDRVGKGFRSSTRDALIADAVSQSVRGRAFGYHRAMDAAGSVVGVLAAAALLWWLVDSSAAVDGRSPEAAAHPSLAGAFRTIFVVAAGLGLVAWGLTLLVRESKVSELSAEPAARHEHTGHLDAGGTATAGKLGFSVAYWRTVTLLLVFSLANSSDAFVLLRAADVGLAPWSVALAYALFMLTQSAFAHPAGVISDRLGRWRIVGVGWGLYACVYIGLAFTGHAGVWPLMALYGVYMALTDGVAKALVAEYTPVDRRGAALGVYYMANGIITLVASVAAGVLWDRVGPAATFGLGAALALLAIVLIPVLRDRSQQETVLVG
jgi:MFS family permease